MSPDSPHPTHSVTQLRNCLGLGAVIAILGGGTFYTLIDHGKAAQTALTIKGRTPPIENARPTLPANEVKPPGDNAPAPELPAEYVVHVAGAVAKPGVYRLPRGARVHDALERAGGADQSADLDSVNLAQKLEDGQQILLPLKPPPGAPPREARPAANPPAGTRAAPRESAKRAKFTQPGRDIVDINTAGAEQLQQLPGVGPAMAERILSHRKENGPFTDPEQLMDVSGIGDKKFARMKAFVRVR